MISVKKGHTSDIRPATLSSWLKQTILLCYKQADQQALDLVQVKAHDIRAFVIAPGWPGMPWFWDLVQLSTDTPLQLPVSTTLLKQSHNYVFHSNPQHLNVHVWCLGVASSKNKESLWRWQRELLPLRGHQQGPSTSQSGPYLRNSAENIRWISPLHL